jgi:glycosyltransferase involved in cell wall biosynthesis
MEVVWINDGSDDMSTQLLEKTLNYFKESTRFCKVVYKKQEKNCGQGFCSSEGIPLCTNEIIFRMDSDDIMMPHRIQTQLNFLNEHPDAVLIGSNVLMFHMNSKNEKVIRGPTNLPTSLSWEEYKETKSHWIMAHPAICFKKSVVLEVGNYQNTQMCEDLEIELKILKKCGKIYNFAEPLVQYRIHPDQVTFQGKSGTPYWIEYRNKMIEDIIQS